MMTKEIEKKITVLWDRFWSGGITNPLNAIEQITYLLFMKQLDENDTQRIDDADHLNKSYVSLFSGTFVPPGEKEENATEKIRLRWSNFTSLPSDEMLVFVQSKVFPFIKQLDGASSYFTRHMANAAFLIPSGRLLSEAVKIINEIYDDLKKQNRFIDAQGDFYEYLLNSLRSAGKNGQFRTPTHIIELISELVQPKLGDKIADPASGTAGFLLGAYKFILTTLSSAKYRQIDNNGYMRGTIADKLVSKSEKKLLNEQTFYGFDIDLTMIRIGLMNLMMHGITQPHIDYKDTLSN
ncbi:MAG: SAM-dependent DNA methyltransferase, partial [Flavobacterium sp.]